MGVEYYMVSHRLKTIYPIGKHPPEIFTGDKVDMDKLEKLVFGLELKKQDQVLRIASVLEKDPDAILLSEHRLPDDLYDQDHWWNTYSRLCETEW